MREIFDHMKLKRKIKILDTRIIGLNYFDYAKGHNVIPKAILEGKTEGKEEDDDIDGWTLL